MKKGSKGESGSSIAQQKHNKAEPFQWTEACCTSWNWLILPTSSCVPHVARMQLKPQHTSLFGSLLVLAVGFGILFVQKLLGFQGLVFGRVNHPGLHASPTSANGCPTWHIRWHVGDTVANKMQSKVSFLKIFFCTTWIGEELLCKTRLAGPHLSAQDWLLSQHNDEVLPAARADSQLPKAQFA